MSHANLESPGTIPGLSVILKDAFGYRFLRAITPESIVSPVREIAWKYI